MDPGAGNGGRLPPLAGVKRVAPGGWDALAAGGGGVGPGAASGVAVGSMQLMLASGRHKTALDESAQFAAAAMAGARAQREVDNARGTNVFETYELGIAIVRSSKLYANQRRSNRQLPGGSDSTTAACYMLGGTPDSTLSPLVARVSPVDPREERCKAVERVLKDKTRGAICTLNGENPREARADNLAAVRICEVVADILVAYAAKRLLNTLQDLYKSNAAKDGTIRALRAQLDGAKRRRADGACWCGGARDAPVSASSAPKFAPAAAVSDGFYAGARDVPLTLPPPPALTAAQDRALQTAASLPMSGASLPMSAVSLPLSGAALLRGSSPLPAHSGALAFAPAAFPAGLDGGPWAAPPAAPLRHSGGK